MEDKFSVYQFFADDTYEQVRSYVEAEEAVKAAHHYCHSVGAKLGTTRRVIITDDGDSTVFEWLYGKGIVFDGERHWPEGRPLPDGKSTPDGRTQ